MNAALLEFTMLAISEAHKDAQTGGSEIYGALVENETFMMHPYCWCDACKWCEPERDGEEAAPNFHYRPTDFKVWWYKYIGRGMRSNRPASIDEMKEILNACTLPNFTNQN